jgi:hypothetical protein
MKDSRSGSSTFKAGYIQFNDGSYVLDGRMSRVTLNRLEQAGNTVYVLQGFIYGKLKKGSETYDIDGNFTVSSKPMGADTDINGAQVDSSLIQIEDLSEVRETN